MRDESRTVVIGVGNELRGDDGVGPAVSRLIAREAEPGVSVLAAPADGLALLDSWRGVDVAIIVDAVSSGAAPGTIHCVHGIDDARLISSVRWSSHSFGIPEAIGLARALGSLPKVLTIYGIEGSTFEAGAGLSQPVRDAAQKLKDLILSGLGGESGVFSSIRTRSA